MKKTASAIMALVIAINLSIGAVAASDTKLQSAYRSFWMKVVFPAPKNPDIMYISVVMVASD